MKVKFLLITLLFLSCGGCHYVANRAGYEKVTRLKEKIAEVEHKAAEQIAKKEEEIRGQLGTVIDSQQDQLQSAANSLFGATLARAYFHEETRPLLIVYNRIDEAKASIGLPPTLKAMEEEQKRLLDELDETKTSLADLKKAHDEKVKENENLVVITNQEKERVEILIQEKRQMEEDFTTKIQSIKNELIKEQDKILTLEKANSEKTKFIEANKRFMMVSLGVASLLSLILAVYLPVYKKESFTFAGITGGLALCIPFLQPIHFTIVFGLGVLAGVVLIMRKMSIGNKVNENLICAIQEFKDTQPEKYKALQPILEEYNKKYKGDDKVEDKSATSHIQEILKDYEKI